MLNLSTLFKNPLAKTIGALFRHGSLSLDDCLQEIEEQLILSDISHKLAERITKSLRKELPGRVESEAVTTALRKELQHIFNVASLQNPGDWTQSQVFLMVGINGSGKTTNSAKLAYYFAQKNEKVLLGAADTFRAAGSSQLSLWGERLNIPVVTGEKGADPGSVVFNTMNSFVSKQYDRVIIDTAGRVQTREQLMRELEKLVKIITKFHEQGPDEVFLVVDGTMGQNTLDQARKFKDFSGLTGLFLTKVDGTTKGGTVVNIVDEMQVPIRFLGVGEQAEDIILFEPCAFIDRLISE